MGESRDFEQVYAGVPPEQAERLKRFRETHPPKFATINGTRWEYIACGQGQAATLWLVGGLRAADAAYRSIPLLEGEFRIVAPTYPPLPTMADMSDGLAGLLDAEGIEKAHVLAGSFGGMLAQVFVRRFPERVGRLILSTTAAPDAGIAERYRQQADMLAAAPPEAAAQVSRAHFLEMIAPPEEERAFWAAYMAELFSTRLNKEDLLCTLSCLLDFAENYRFAPDDLAGWAGRILIIEAEDDATFDAAARERLKGLYPEAQVYTFAGGGHSPGTTRREAYFGLVSAFFNAG